ncbi:phytanoyl-CoA dioxygenase family protein [Pseudomonas sp. GM55]|jgi:ectoine hydroxylase-related dioxygenase (phytanoyl-CoA dioxygenase family)|uniref:phytanoyl-CoA dioxygenase family protein n=1 Tax=Pseudomonas sp. GM55 TaxID=1144333 RepID=UPI000270CD9F|nr:phytanoyl-CoA dioxygenase family protein [Pseudomonas sp. GM55]EJM74810.1 protein involved in biosynthesis of mitomycin antibiotics/polyketide fumonisin [Pseudomonas sp. GM55]
MNDMAQHIQSSALPVSDETVRAFRHDGAVCIRNAFTPQLISELTQGIEHNLAQPSLRAKVASNPDDPGWFFEDFCNWQTNAHYRNFIFNSAIAPIAAALLDSQQVRLHHDHLLVKEPNTRQRTPWHQDQPYYNISGADTVSFWIPVDPVPRESTLEFIAGSHKGPWLMPRSFMDSQAKWFAEGTLDELPDIESHREDFPILGWALSPGDMVCFNMLTLHASSGVAGQNRRRAFSVRVIGDDVRHAPRSWVTSPHFPGLEETLAADAPLEHPLFPSLWPR